MPGFAGTKVLGLDFLDTSATAQHQLGARATTDDGKLYVYVKADGTGHASGDSVTVTSAYVTTTAAAAGAVFGVADKAVAANLYYWVCVGGQVTAKVTGSPASGTLLQFPSVGTGQLQAIAAVNESGATAHAAGAQTVRGITQSTVSGGVATVFLYYV